MFWKRKPKKQDGQEAPDSAAEAAVDDKEKVETVDSGTVENTSSDKPDGGGKAEKEDSGETGSEKADDTVETAEESTDTEGSNEAEKAEKEPAKADAAEKADEKVDEKPAKAEDADEDSGEDAEADDSDAEDSDGDSDEDEDAEEEPEPEPEKKADLFADEDEDGKAEAGVTGPDSEGITRVRSVGVFEFDDEKTDIVSNTWIIKADDEGVVVIDPAHDAEAILEAVGDRDIYLVACTNAYSPHIEAAIKIAEEVEAPIALHPREMRAWRRHHGAEHRPEIEVEGEGALDIGDLHIDVVALPGTSSGSVGYYVSQLGAVFSGDTLRKGEPGMVGNTYIDYTTQLASIGEGLLTLPPDTRVLPDRGPATTAAAESKNFDAWV